MTVNKKRRAVVLVLAVALLYTPLQGTCASDDQYTPYPSSSSSRIPLLDESELDKFSKPPAEYPPEESIDMEYGPDIIVPLDTKNLRYFSYFAKVQRAIDRSYYYPRDAVSDLLNGIVSLSFEVLRDGSLGEVKVISSSGKKVLDEAASDIVNRAAPFPSVPSRIQHTPIKVSTQIRFRPSQEAVKGYKSLDVISVPLK